LLVEDGEPTVSHWLVTGCAGFVGSHLVETLLDYGDDVIGVDAFTDYYERDVKNLNIEVARDHDSFTLVAGDLTELDLDSLFAGVDGVFHLAAQPGVRGSWGETFAIYLRDNVLATQCVFEAAARRHLRVVFASSSSIYGNAERYPTHEDITPAPLSPYGVTKLACEELAQAYGASFGLDTCALRYFTVYGPRQRPDMAFTRLCRALQSAGIFSVYGTGEQSRDVTYVSDAVSATVAAMHGGVAGRAYNVGGGVETSLREVIELAEYLTGRTLEVKHQSAAAGDVRRTAADTTLIRQDLGWSPATPLETGLAAQVEWTAQTGETALGRKRALIFR
jgi:UDP-glucuronate 4-epimerase